MQAMHHARQRRAGECFILRIFRAIPQALGFCLGKAPARRYNIQRAARREARSLVRDFIIRETSVMQIQLKVNGQAVTLDVPPNTLLVQALREQLRLTGTHVGCDTAQCGACTVLMNGHAVKSCNILAAQAQGAEVTTIEGLAGADGAMHPMQAAFKECHGLQCGFCTTGMVMSAVDLCTHHPNASEAEIRELLEGNLCRCTGYQNIVKAVQQGAAAMRA
jgi:carbon-monoxide dehydrogenase small subunit